MDKEAYEEELAKKQRTHLKMVQGNLTYRSGWQPCLHDGCTQCCGTGIKLDGSPCIHHLACPCPKCTPTC